MRHLTAFALETARLRGATYADIRVVESKAESLAVRNGRIGSVLESETLGFGVRVICQGAWGFASSSDVTKSEIQRVAALAVEIAKSSARLSAGRRVRLAPQPAYQTTWSTPYLLDPFSVPTSEKLDLLLAIDKTLRRSPKISVAYSEMQFERERTWLATSEGAFIDQTLLKSGVGYSATAVGKGETQIRSYPASHGGQNSTMGYELVKSLPLLENAERIREEAVALLTAKPCPSGKKDLILDGSQLALQIHESCGHPSELDRVLGMEANFAGTSFLTREKRGKLRYGSPLVNLIADTTLPTGLGTRGFDDEGVPAQRWHIVKDGRFVGYLTNREVAHAIGEERSRGCCRADGWQNLPMIRIPNLSLMPGDHELDDILGDTRDGVFMACNKSWSIDQQRLNFQFGCEIGWEVKRGKLGAMVKHPTYQGITPEFWGSCDAIASERHWKLWGVRNCGKGQPAQTAGMSHGAAPARFRNVTVGVGATA
ncbi:MAG: TldD/PmbA family protein [Planctomycetes bacterium]|nr:TldD/PmbA family protein [Planctomycetota bacterium]